MTMRQDRLEFMWLAAALVLIIAPTVTLCALGALLLGRAESAYERDVREAYARAAAKTVSECVREVQGCVEGAEESAERFAAAQTPEGRSLVADEVTSLEGLAVLDPRFEVVYPPRERYRSLEEQNATAFALREAERVEYAEGAAAAVGVYQEVLGLDGVSQDVALRTQSGLARCLAAAGRTAEAVAMYEELATEESPPGEFSLPLLGRYRAWELEPTAEHLDALAASCLDTVLVAPAGQVQYYLGKAGEPPDEAIKRKIAVVLSVLSLRAQDERTAAIAAFAAAPGTYDTRAGWKWRCASVGDKWRLVGVGPAVDGRGAAGVIVVSLDPGILAGTIVRPVLEGGAAQTRAQFVLGVRPIYGRFAEEPASSGLVASQAFPAPFDFWTIEVYSTAGEIRGLAKGRAALVYWGVLLSGAALLVGVATAFLWATRRMRLARLQTDFVTNVTHELKTPLTGIKSLAETLLLGRITSAESSGEFLSAIVRETDRLSRLINNVLDFSRLERGVQKLNLAKADLAALACDAAAAFEKGFNEDEEVSVATSAPAQPVYAVVDADVITRAIFNLLDNAYKYSSPPREISLSVARRGGEAVVSVKDNGVGLTRAQMRRVFGKFYRVETGLSAGTQGAGLGLTLVRSYALAHGGRVQVESRPNQGSTFSIALPLAKEDGR